jgi:hypothetical protein
MASIFRVMDYAKQETSLGVTSTALKIELFT